MRTTSILVACVLIAGCERQSQPPITTPVAVTDDAQRLVQLPHPATRVVSLMPTVTDLIIAMGRAQTLIARTDYDTDPVIAQLPSIGGGLTPSVEWIAQQKPDLVISWPDRGSRSLVVRITSLGVSVYSAKTVSVQDAIRTIRKVGVLLDATSSADSLAAAITSELDSTHNSVAHLKRVRVAYILSIEPPMVAGPGTFIQELIEVAGGTNVFNDLKQSWAQVNLEELVARDPDVLILARESSAPVQDVLRDLPGWRDLRAVKSGHVHRVSPDYFNRSGPLMPKAARELVRFFESAR